MDAATMPLGCVFWYEQGRDREHVLTDPAEYWLKCMPVAQAMEEIIEVQERGRLEAVGVETSLQCNVVPEAQSSPLGEDDAQSDVPVPPLVLVEAQTVSKGSPEAAGVKAKTIFVEATLHFATLLSEGICGTDFFLRDDPDRPLHRVRHDVFHDQRWFS